MIVEEGYLIKFLPCAMSSGQSMMFITVVNAFKRKNLSPINIILISFTLRVEVRLILRVLFEAHRQGKREKKCTC